MFNAYVRIGARLYTVSAETGLGLDEAAVLKMQSVKHDGKVSIHYFSFDGMKHEFPNKEAACASLTPAPEIDDDYLPYNGGWIKTADYLARMEAVEKVFGQWAEDVDAYERSM